MAFSDCTTMWEGSGQFSYTKTSAEAVMVYRCPWVDRFTSKDNFLDATHQANDHSDDSNLKAATVEIEKLGDVSDVVNRPKQAKLTVTFIPEKRWLRAGLEGDTDNWLTSVDFAGDAFTLAGSKWKWSDTGSALGSTDPEHAVKVIPYADFNITGTWDVFCNHMLDYVDGVLGCINEKIFINWPAETLLFVGLNVDQKPNSDVYTYNYHFRYNPNTWNKFYREKDNTWTAVQSATDSSIKPYTIAPFSDLVPDNWAH